ncbi:zinc ABC transporter ATP-binding protein [Spirochaetia bacterium]|nr:zinc ABC transporter ATP-binding protein [Spirochaetia bacterium]
MEKKDADSIITCQNVSLGYDGQSIVHGLSFSIDSGDYLCIVGENGCGKTTLIKALLRLLKPMEGSIHFSAAIKENKIGYLSQQSAAKKDFPAGVREVVLQGMIGAMGLRPFYTRREKEIAAENMKRLEITDLQNRCFRELSGGQQRRVLIARALCAAETALVLDEPAAGLDPVVSVELYDYLKKLNREWGITIVMVTHDIEAAVTHASKILHIKNEGHFFGETAEYIKSEAGKDFFKTGGVFK